MQSRNYDVLLLRPQEIRDVIDIATAIDLVEQGYREAQSFPLINAPRRRVHSRDNVRISNFPGGVDGLGVIGSLTRGEQVKHDASSQDYPYREHPVYLLWHSETARLQCIMIGEITEKHIGFSSLSAPRRRHRRDAGQGVRRPRRLYRGLCCADRRGALLCAGLFVLQRHKNNRDAVRKVAFVSLA
jgi:hypothetical protein